MVPHVRAAIGVVAGTAFALVGTDKAVGGDVGVEAVRLVSLAVLGGAGKA